MSAKTPKTVLSVCWDRSRFYFVIGKLTKSRTTIVTAKSGSWIDEFNAVEAAERINEELGRHKIRRPALTIGVSRAQVDMCATNLPPATAAEIPQIVSNEVSRQFGELPTDAIIDYDVDESTEPRVANAFLLRSESAQNITAFAEAMGLDVHSILLRQYSVASLFDRLHSQPGAASLLLNLLDQSADLLVVRDRQVVAGRTILYGKNSESIQTQRLSAEVLRTVAANPSIGSVDRVYVFGRNSSADEFALTIEEYIPYSVTVLDPLGGTEHGGIRGDDQSFPMAALVGMIRDVQEDSALIDFANPKRPPPAPNRWFRMTIYTVAVAAVAALLFYTYGLDLKRLDTENANLQTQLDTQSQLLEKLQSKTIIVDAVGQWENMGVNWLDEIRDFTVRFPPEGEGIVDRMTCMPGNGPTGTITMGVRVRDPSIVAELESALRDPYRQIRSKRITQADQDQAFPCQFDTTIVLRRRPKDQYTIPSAGAESPTNASRQGRD